MNVSQIGLLLTNIHEEGKKIALTVDIQILLVQIEQAERHQ